MSDVERRLKCLLVAALAGGCFACSSTDKAPSPSYDLPADWANAKSVADLVQVECAHGTLEFNEGVVSFQPGPSRLAVDYEQAHFRCEQDVTGYYKVEGEALDILVQPLDMHPTAVASCDCVYGITFAVKPLVSGAYQATLYRRWDDWNDVNDPVKVASEQVTIE